VETGAVPAITGDWPDIVLSDEEENGILQLTGQGSLITVDGGKLTIQGSLTLKGVEDNNVGLISVNGGGRLVLEDDAVITGNTNSSSYGGVGGGGGVYVPGGAFTMRGGTISGNTANENGGGVLVTGGSSTFEMSGGTISGNKANGGWDLSFGGGGVFVKSESTFTMRGGTISGNEANKQCGGGVGVNGSKFYMHGGIISGNTAKWYGGGVSVRTPTFEKKPEDGSSTSGVIYGNDPTDETLKNTAQQGHAVYYSNAGSTKKRDVTVDSDHEIQITWSNASGSDLDK
jgi:hypothetical protein